MATYPLRSSGVQSHPGCIIVEGADGVRISKPITTAGARRIKSFEKESGGTRIITETFNKHSLQSGAVITIRAGGWAWDDFRRHPANGTWTVTKLDDYKVLLLLSAWGTLDPYYAENTGVLWPGSLVDARPAWTELRLWADTQDATKWTLPLGLLGCTSKDPAYSNTGFTIPHGAQIKGAGMDGTMLIAGDALNAFLLQAVDKQGYSLEDFTVNGNRMYMGVGGYHAVRLGKLRNVLIRRFRSANSAGYGITAGGGATNLRLEDCEILCAENDCWDGKNYDSTNHALYFTRILLRDFGLGSWGTGNDATPVRQSAAGLDIRGWAHVTDLTAISRMSFQNVALRLRSGQGDGGLSTFNGDGGRRSTVKGVHAENLEAVFNPTANSVAVEVACDQADISGVTAKGFMYGLRFLSESKRNIARGLKLEDCETGFEDRGEENRVESGHATACRTSVRVNGGLVNTDGNLPTTDPFTTTVNSGLVTVYHVGHGRAVGQDVTFYNMDGNGALRVGGLNLRRLLKVYSIGVPTADHFTVYDPANYDPATNTGAKATVAETGGGTGVVYLYPASGHTSLFSKILNFTSEGATVRGLELAANAASVFVAGWHSLGDAANYVDSASDTEWGPGNRGVPRMSRGIALLPTTVTTTPVTADDNGKRFLTQNASGLNIVELNFNPDSYRDWEAEFICRDTDGLRVKVGTGYILEFGSIGVTASGGYAETSGTGAVKGRSVIKVRAVRNNAFMVVSHEGDWALGP